MAEEGGFRGKSMKAIASDVAEGYFTVNPLSVKKFDNDMIKGLYENLNKGMTAIRNEKVSYTDTVSLRQRNMRLQRMHNALIVLRNIAREKRIQL
jgi:hypothetical protein